MQRTECDHAVYKCALKQLAMITNPLVESSLAMIVMICRVRATPLS